MHIDMADCGSWGGTVQVLLPRCRLWIGLRWSLQAQLLAAQLKLITLQVAGTLDFEALHEMGEREEQEGEEMLIQVTICACRLQVIEFRLDCLSLD